MTTSESKLAEAIRARLQELDAERDKLTALLQHYTGGQEKTPADQMTAEQKPEPQQSGNPFQAREGGPTERLLEVIGKFPGLTYGKVIDKAEVGLVTEASNPRRSLGSTLGSLVKAGKVVKRGAEYHLPAQTETAER